MQQVTIKDIARLAGVSVTTVSRALNHAPEIRAETRERILKLCREQGYRTNLLARSLVSSRSNVLGLILPSISNPFYAALALNIETFARERGYQVMLSTGRPGDDRIETLFDFLISQRVDAVLLANASDAAHVLLGRYHETVPCVLLGSHARDTSRLRINAVSVDNYAGGHLAAEYLHRLGHRRVVYLGRRLGTASHTLRYKGFRDAARELEMELRTVENTGGSSSVENGRRMGLELLSAPLPETAVFAASDAVALGVLQAADELGVDVPGQLSLMGFDNIEYAGLPGIQLTTLSQNVPLLARTAVRLTLELIESQEQEVYTRKLVTPTLIERATCRPLTPDGAG
ncbi:LacI family DNA-binding transcriptional regulator [Dysosmobacter sp. Marseille-Q4140]|nr:LacI family DNA-binding transcriptional regulator [Dysosmobacter sp. Marseille-Q4140]